MPDIDPERAKLVAQAAGELLTKVSFANTQLATQLETARNDGRESIPLNDAGRIVALLNAALQGFIERVNDSGGESD